MIHYYVYAGIRSSRIDPWYKILAYLYTEASSEEEAKSNWETIFAQYDKTKWDHPVVRDIGRDCPHIEQYFVNGKHEYFDGSMYRKARAPLSECSKEMVEASMKPKESK